MSILQVSNSNFFYQIPPILLFIAIGAIYFIPSILGRNKKNSKSIFMLNLFLGWTFLGWVAALIWAVSHEK